MRFSRFSVGATLLVSLTLASRARADASDLVPEVGYNYGEVETARSAAMGGALRALGNGVTGLYLNPANMALTRVYHLMALAQIWPELLPMYEKLYANGRSYLPDAETRPRRARVNGLAQQFEIADRRRLRIMPAAVEAPAEQLMLILSDDANSREKVDAKVAA